MYNKLENVNYDYLKEIEDKIKNKDSLSREELFYFLEYVIWDVRNKIYDEDHPYFEYKCDLAQSMICYYLNDIKVVNYPCSTNNTIYSSVMGHSFVVATFKVDGKDVNYLIDPTYIQFFKKEDCNESKYVVINGYIVVTPSPGYFIKIEDTARVGLFNYYGFDVLDEELARIYGNSFYNTRSMKRVKTFDELSGSYYINSFLKNGNEKLSKSLKELDDNGMIINIMQLRKKTK